MPDSVRRHPCQVLSIRSSSITPGLRGRRGLRSWRGLRNWRGLRRRKGLSLTDLTDTRSHLRGCKDRSKATWDPRQRSKATRPNVHPPWPSGWCGVGRKVNTVCVLSEDCSWKRHGPAPRGPADRTDPPQIFPENFSSIFIPKSFVKKNLGRVLPGGLAPDYIGCFQKHGCFQK